MNTVKLGLLDLPPFYMYREYVCIQHHKVLYIIGVNVQYTVVYKS